MTFVFRRRTKYSYLLTYLLTYCNGVTVLTVFERRATLIQSHTVDIWKDT